MTMSNMSGSLRLEALSPSEEILVCNLDVSHHWQPSATSVFTVLACSKWIVKSLGVWWRIHSSCLSYSFPTLSFSITFVQSTLETFEGF
jgi:hypothetical protein